MNILVVGGGKVGVAIARLLLDSDHQVTVIEVRREHHSALPHDVPEAALVFGSGTDPAMLEASGIRRADVVAAVTGADETNLVVTSLARYEYGVRRTIARVNNPKNACLFTPEMGVDIALNQAELIARLIAEDVKKSYREG
jgi:trk system potassium uptake protein TrkA